MFAQNPACECVQKWGWRGPDCNTDVNECSLVEVRRWKNGFLRIESVLFEREKSASAKTGLGQIYGQLQREAVLAQGEDGSADELAVALDVTPPYGGCGQGAETSLFLRYCFIPKTISAKTGSRQT